MDSIRVLSLFDGMSCGQIALRELGVPVERYYASEVDKFAIAQTQLNFPDTVHLGDVRNIDVDRLCEDGEIDLLIGGSPCTDFSFAGKRRGMSTTTKEKVTSLSQYNDLKEAGFEFEGQSYLFWEYMRILTDLRRRNPNIRFLLENVRMKKGWELVLSEAIGCRGVHINSALVSAQNRHRIYWTNIRQRKDRLFDPPLSDIPQPADRGVLLKDILEMEVDEKYYLKEEAVRNLLVHQERNRQKGNGFGMNPKCENQKMNAIKVGGGTMYDLACVRMVGRDPLNPTSRKPSVNGYKQFIEPRADQKTGCLTTVEKDNLLLIPEATKSGFAVIRPGEAFDVTHKNSASKRGRRMAEKVHCLTTQSYGNYLLYEGVNPHLAKNLTDADGKASALLATSHKGPYANGMTLVEQPRYRIRRLTPTECARLQTIPEWYEWKCSPTQQLKMLGNGWTVEVIKHILGFLR